MHLGLSILVVHWLCIKGVLSQCSSPCMSNEACIAGICQKERWCHPPIAPFHGYVTSGRSNRGGAHIFRYKDEASVVCEPGYIMTNGELSMSATCMVDGSWNRDITHISCRSIVCSDPGEKYFATRHGIDIHYMSQVSYHCQSGYFVAPGITSVTIVCSLSGYWHPSNEFVCKVVYCEHPGALHNAVHTYTPKHNDIAAKVVYSCKPGYYIADYQDKFGNWVVSKELKHTFTVKCSLDGMWEPSFYDVYCSNNINGAALTDVEGLNHDSMLVPNSLKQQLEGGGVSTNVQALSHLNVYCPKTQKLALKQSGHWLKVSKENISTFHESAIQAVSGAKLGVWLMWDENPNTHWKPVEFPKDENNRLLWEGWLFSIDLGQAYAISSFRMHTSNNFKNDVETFNVLFSLDNVEWKSIGPFISRLGSNRISFYHNFQLLQARFLKVNITSTVLMRPPIVSRFGIYGAPYNCSKPAVRQDWYAVSTFVASLAALFLLLLRFAIRRDQICCWRRYILSIPSHHTIRPPYTFEFSITTAWKSIDVDLMVRLHGSLGSTPVIWIRRGYPGLLRPGFTDTLKLHTTSDIGTPLKVSFICFNRDLFLRNEIESQLELGGEPRQSISKTLLNLSTSAENKRESSPRKPTIPCIGIGCVTVRDPKAEVICYLDIKPCALLVCWPKKKCLELKHEIPVALKLKTEDEKISSFPKNLFTFIFRHHLLSPIVHEKTLTPESTSMEIEKLLLAFMIMGHSLLFTALSCGLDVFTLLIPESGQNKTIESDNYNGTSIKIHWLPQVPIVASASSILLVLQLLSNALPVKWIYKLEDAILYHKGLAPFKTFVELLIATFNCKRSVSSKYSQMNEREIESHFRSVQYDMSFGHRHQSKIVTHRLDPPTDLNLKHALHKTVTKTSFFQLFLKVTRLLLNASCVVYLFFSFLYLFIMGFFCTGGTGVDMVVLLSANFSAMTVLSMALVGWMCHYVVQLWRSITHIYVHPFES